jgi:hypothetical protein
MGIFASWKALSSVGMRGADRSDNVGEGGHDTFLWKTVETGSLAVATETNMQGIVDRREGENDRFGVICEEESSLDSFFSTIGVFFSDTINSSTGTSLNRVWTVDERGIVGGVFTTPSARRTDGEVGTGLSMCKAFGLSGGDSRGFFRIHSADFAGSEGGEKGSEFARASVFGRSDTVCDG